MTKSELNNEYFEWLYNTVCDIDLYSKKRTYRKLLMHLHSVDFDYIMPMDGNRAENGTDLRYRFGYEHEYEGPMIASYLDDRPCSVLEMMVALALHCEEHIMYDPDEGNRTGRWFWDMVASLGLTRMNDLYFDRNYTDEVIERFLRRNFKRNGEGGLFTVQNVKYDMRTREIWYQLCDYVNEIL